MKKHLWLLLVIPLVFSATEAITLKGILYQYADETNKPLIDVQIILDGKPQSELSKETGFKIRDFEIKNQSIDFKLDGYYTTKGEITVKKDNGKDYLVYNDNYKDDYYFGIIKKKLDGSYDQNATYTLGIGENTTKIKLLREANSVITGYVEYDNGKKASNVSITGMLTDEDGLRFPVEQTKTDIEGKFTINGYNNSTKKYELDFSASGYNKKTEIITVQKDKEVTLDKPIVLEERSTAGTIQDDLEAMTDFECGDLLPKYLVGANCVENRKLQGDATDFALWIQKFGGKITAMIGMVAVVLIVWNAFNIVTAAGEMEQIEQGKKGILWTILGLALTMFAYVIVKTVTMF